MRRLTLQRLDDLLERARTVRVLVVGDLMLDIYLRGAASRLSPEAPVPVVQVEDEWQSLGGAGNVAANVAALGASCTLVACLGADSAGAKLSDAVRRAGISPGGLHASSARQTTVKTRIMVRQHQVARYDREETLDIDPDTAAALTQAIEREFEGVDAIVLEDYNKGVLVPTVIEAALDAGRRRGCPVIVDPKSNHFFDYRGATVFKPNLAELAAALRAPVFPNDPDWLDRIRRHLDCSHLLVTLGEDGMALVTDEGEHLHVPAIARSVYDVSGAGDTVTASLAVAIAAGASIAEAAVLANYAAAIEVGKAGVATVAPQELRDLVATQSP